MSKSSRRRPAGADPRATDPSAGRPVAPGTAETGTGTTGAAGGPAGTPRTSVRPQRPVSSRAGRRERARPTAQRSPLERFRLPIVVAAVVGAVALMGVWAFSSAGAAAYECSTEFTPGTTDGQSGAPGFVQPDMGQRHVGTGTEVTYTYCPPASGPHYNAAGRGPITPRVYGPDDNALPQGWVHNLEHGALVVLYRGRDGDPGLSDAVQQELQSFYADFPDSPVCGFAPGQVGPVVARFDQMPSPYAALVWGRVLPLDTLDTTRILEFYQRFGERTNPEKFCALPSDMPSGAPSGSPAASPSPS